MCAAISDVEQTHLYPFLQVSQIFQRRKSDANKQDLEMKVKFDLEVYV